MKNNTTKKSVWTFIKNLLIFLIMIAIGVGIAIYMMKSKDKVEHTDTAMQPRAVEVITLEKQPFSATATAYGYVEPAVVLRGKAEVSGKASYVHPELREGGSIPAGTVVVRIDPEDYKTNLQQTKADLAANQSQLAQIEQEEANTRRSLQLAQENLRLGQQELARVKSIWEKRLIARSVLDSEEQRVIQLRQTVSDLQGQLNTYQSRRDSANAQINRSQQQVKGQKTTLGRTEITIPFDARISSASVENNEFVATGNVLFEAINTDGVEIEAELPLMHMRALVSAMRGKAVDANPANTKALLESLGLKATVRLVNAPDSQATWEGRVARIAEAVDPTRRTLGIVIAVDKPYDNVVIGEKPPLLKGMYVAVELYAPETDALVIPRKALHQGHVYLMDDTQKLEVRPVRVQAQQGNQVIIAEGLQAGEQLIVNDLVPVIKGMPLKAIEAAGTVSPQQDKPDNSSTDVDATKGTL